MKQRQTSLNWAHPLVREWFLKCVGIPTRPQIEAWPHILAKKSTLISAPTGSGKTLTAFLSCLNRLIVEAISDDLSDNIHVVYISPLKALSSDIQKNLAEPLRQIADLAQKQGFELPEIRVGLRTGDTPQSARQQMLRKPPHILITTPESLYILLTAEKSRAMFTQVHTVIVDEIHALAKDKRGVHLSLTLERLEANCKVPLTRIGLSATQKPLELIAQFLVGSTREMPTIVDIGHERKRDLLIEVPKSPLSAVASNEIWDEIYERLTALANEHRSTLIFTNTRRLAERIAHNLSERLGDDVVFAHHGSLSRKLRLDIESKLKEGRLKALVATASLELGIDIGELDLVCQIGSPRSIAVGLQRIGRAGHFYQGISKGRFFATTRDELLECAALIKAVFENQLDALIMPKNSLDILAQQIIATVATGPFLESDLFSLVKGAYPYNELSKEDFEQVLSILSDGISGARGRYGAYLFRDRVNGVISARRNSRIVAITNGSAIADNGLFTVIAEPQNVVVGTLDEDFAVESSKGEIILLGTTSWRILRIEAAAGRVIVENAHGAPPNVPFWRGEAPGRTTELSFYVGDLRQKISDQLPLSIENDALKTNQNFLNTVDWLKSTCHMGDFGAEQLAEYVFLGKSVLKTVPSQNTIVAERFFDESGGMQLVIHAPFGARINKAWGLALRKCFCRSFNFELQASATDDGLNIALLEQHSFPLEDVFRFLHPNTLKDVLVQAILQSPIFKTRFRWAAMRSLALIRYRSGKKVPPNILRMLSDDLLASVFPDAAACQDNLAGKDITLPNHPLINEAMNDVLNEALDIEGLHNLIERIYDQSITCMAIDTPIPSVFAHEILNANPYAFLDDAPLEERRARAVEMRNILPHSALKQIGILDKEVIAQVKAQSLPDIRNADELHDVLQTLIACPKEFVQSFTTYFLELVTKGRAAKASCFGREFYVAAESKKRFLAIYGNSIIHHELADILEPPVEREEAITHMIRQWMFMMGPTTSKELSELLSLEQHEIDCALLRLESTGLVLRGHFSNSNDTEWCERRLLARIHRLTVEKLRKEIEPASFSKYLHWLLKWQHLLPGTQLNGEQGLLEIIRKLQGFELPAHAWETHIFKPRLTDYQPTMLDYLGLKGLIGWGRLSKHPALIDGSKKMVIPRVNAPITFFLRLESDWLLHAKEISEDEQGGLSSLSKVIFSFLKERGASFFPEIEKALRVLPSSLETALWQLITAGLVTADDFDNMRALLNPHRRASRLQGLRNSTGRFSIFCRNNEIDPQKQIEASALLLLRRYGIVFREIFTREKNMPPFRELLKAFRNLENRGEIRGGCFVSGFSGEQFALPEALESLRITCREKPKELCVKYSAIDPVNLSSLFLSTERIPAHVNKDVFFKYDNFHDDKINKKTLK